MPLTKKELEELISNDVISPEVADNIRTYFQRKQSSVSVQNRLMTLFSAIGALLAGLGVILLIAHNWDTLHRGVKVGLALLLLLGAQGMGYYALKAHADKPFWKQGAAVFLYLTIGATIALISQTYNLGGRLEDFLLVWSLLGFPLVYVFESSGVALLLMFTASYLGVEADVGFMRYATLGLIATTVPYFYMLLLGNKKSPSLHFMCWGYALVLPPHILHVFSQEEAAVALSFLNMTAVFYLLGKRMGLSPYRYSGNAFYLLGGLTLLAFSYAFTFSELWEVFDKAERFRGWELAMALGVMALAFAAYLFTKEKGNWLVVLGGFVLINLLVVLPVAEVVAAVCMNLYLLGIGVVAMREGVTKLDLGNLNGGLFIVCLLIFSRFFDIEVSMLIRGLAFIALGAAFFAVNAWLIRKKKDASSTSN